MNTSHLFVALVMLFCWSNQITAQNKELINHIDALGVKDYLELNERQGNELSHLLPVLKNGFDNHEAKVIFKRSKHVSHNLIVVEISPMDMVPGATLAIVHFFREDGELIKSHVFNVGYRESLYSIRVMKSPEINDYMVEIQTHGMSEGGGQQLKFFNNEAEWRPRYRQYTQHQLYAFQNNQVRLVRLTNEDGKLISNQLRVKHFNYGPVCDYSLDQIEQLLKSKSVIDQLHVLTWLNSKHFTDDPRSWNEYNHEKKQSIDAFAKAHDSPDIRQLIVELEKSSCRWVNTQAYWTRTKLAKPLSYDDPNE